MKAKRNRHRSWWKAGFLLKVHRTGNWRGARSSLAKWLFSIQQWLESQRWLSAYQALCSFLKLLYQVSGWKTCFQSQNESSKSISGSKRIGKKLIGILPNWVIRGRARDGCCGLVESPNKSVEMTGLVGQPWFVTHSNPLSHFLTFMKGPQKGPVEGAEVRGLFSNRKCLWFLSLKVIPFLLPITTYSFV